MNIKLSEEDYKEINYCLKYKLVIPTDIRLKIYKFCCNDENKTIKLKISKIINIELTLDNYEAIPILFPELSQVNYSSIVDAKPNFCFLDSLNQQGWDNRITFLKTIIKKLENGKWIN